MRPSSIQDILPLVQLPSRYLGNEVNSIKKDWKNSKLHIALAFPDLYEIATSHFGIQILYHILNTQPDIMAERVFAPAIDMENQMRKNNVPLCSLESETPIANFDIIGFSLLYELNYTNMLNMLDMSGIPFISKERGSNDPFVIGGGPCTCNPEPVADFFDAIVVGDGEAVILKLTDAWSDWKNSGSNDRSDLLKRWSGIKGVYIPSFFDVVISNDGRTRLEPGSESHGRIQRAVLNDLNLAMIPEKPVLPYGRPVHDRLRMEIARGCTRGCRFCQAGMIYRPVRERHPDTIITTLLRAIEETGYEDVSLLSLSTGDYSCIAPLMKNIMQFGPDEHLAISLPSLRAGSLTPELMDLIRKVRKTGFTIAPEAGSQRLRDVINKNISESDIVDTVRNAFQLGWKVIKLYFMIGLPTETQADLEAIVDLVHKIKAISPGRGRHKINVSFATFVPKPHTPFQWEDQIGLDLALEKLQWLKTQLNGPGIQVKWQDPKVSMIEAVWARGDRKLGPALIEAWKSGCRFDGWSDFFDFDRWISVFEKCGIDTGDYTKGWLDVDKPLPWDHINIGVTRSYLVRERQRGFENKITTDCRSGDCSGCGVCDFKNISPISFHRRQEGVHRSVVARPELEKVQTQPVKYRVSFSKMGPARHLGHLEMVKLFVRGIRRAAIPILYSSGFHPMPKISFGDTLPLGMQSELETMLITLVRPIAPEVCRDRLGREMPEGFDIISCERYTKQKSLETEQIQNYHIELKDGLFSQNHLDLFVNAPVFTIEGKNKHGKTVLTDIKQAVVNIELIDSKQAAITIKAPNRKLVRPSRILRSVFKLNDSQLLEALITKKRSYV